MSILLQEKSFEALKSQSMTQIRYAYYQMSTITFDFVAATLNLLNTFIVFKELIFLSREQMLNSN